MQTKEAAMRGLGGVREQATAADRLVGSVPWADRLRRDALVGPPLTPATMKTTLLRMEQGCRSPKAATRHDPPAMFAKGLLGGLFLFPLTG
jgi:hypothetical protein